MLRAAVIADSHFDQHSRFEECIRLHEWIRADAAARDVDLVLHSGDVYERKSTPLEREAVAEWVQGMAAIAPVVIVRGNHDALGDLPLLERLEAPHKITVVEEARIVHAAGVQVVCVAWPRKAALLAACGAESHEAGEATAAEALRNVLRGLGAQLQDEPGPNALLMHAMVRDSITSTGQPLVGCDMEIGLEDLALVGADTYLLGHIHRSQAFRVGDSIAIYPGSPRRANFGELEAKGYTLVTWHDDATVSLEFIEVPATPMLHISALWQGSLLHYDYVSVAGAEVRLRYTTPSDTREAAKAAAANLREELLAAGAVSVQVEELVIAEQRARSPELAKALTLDEKIAALWTAKGYAPDAVRRSALLDKVHGLEELANAS